MTCRHYAFHQDPDPAEQIYQAAEGIRNWWTREAVLEPRTGEFRFYDGKSVTKVIVAEMKPTIRAAFASFRQQWDGTTISFDLRPDS